MSKIVLHPGVESTPQMTLAEALGHVHVMADCLVMFTDTKGQMHIAWSDQSNADLAASAVVLSHLAATRLVEDA